MSKSTMSTIILLLLAISVSLTTGVSTYQVQVDGVDQNLTLCDNTAYNKYVHAPTGRESFKLEPVLGVNISDERMVLLNDFNVSRRVCSDLAVYMTAKKINRTESEETVLEYAEQIHSLLKTPGCEITNSTVSSDTTSMTFLHNYCLYWFGRFIEREIGSIKEIRNLLKSKACPNQTSA